jgi:hypothetical protein
MTCSSGATITETNTAFSGTDALFLEKYHRFTNE